MLSFLIDWKRIQKFRQFYDCHPYYSFLFCILNCSTNKVTVKYFRIHCRKQYFIWYRQFIFHSYAVVRYTNVSSISISSTDPSFHVVNRTNSIYNLCMLVVVLIFPSIANCHNIRLFIVYIKNLSVGYCLSRVLYLPVSLCNYIDTI